MALDKDNVTNHGHDDVSQEHHIRVEKAKKLRAMGIEPWPAQKEVSATAEQVLGSYYEGTTQEYTVAGRIIALRAHGKSSFAKLQDRSGQIQVYFKEDVIGENAFSMLHNFIDLGDIIWVRGVPFTTKTGEVTIKVEEFTLLSKCLHPLPEKFHGIADVEIRYRQRYLDLISDKERKQKFITRSKLISGIRHFLESHDFIEVETPMLHPIPGGAAAKPFITKHNALGSDFYLRIAPELYLKRLVVGGFERVYEINRNFRNEGVSTRHNPEFTMLEFYLAHHDYKYMMDFVEELFRSVITKACGSTIAPFGDHTIDFGKAFARMNVQTAITTYSDYTAADITPDAIDTALSKAGAHVPNKDAHYTQKLFALFEAVAESKLIQPTFIIDFPVEMSPLAKRDFENPSVVGRFELFIAGMELANGFNELNDPFDQAERFQDQVKNRESGDDEAHHYDADFIKALEHGLPPTVGCGIGIDRLAMLLTNTTSIKDVILFPTLKRKD
jgi:lysyl-tRNA synthetase class 2